MKLSSALSNEFFSMWRIAQKPRNVKSDDRSRSKNFAYSLMHSVTATSLFFVAVVSAQQGAFAQGKRTPGQEQWSENQRFDGETYIESEASSESAAPGLDGETLIGPAEESSGFDVYDRTESERQGDGEEAREASGSKTTFYERKLGRWKDPFSLPHTRVRCVKWAWGHIPLDGRWKACVGHKLQAQWIYSAATLRVDTKNPQALRTEVEACLRTGALASAAVGIGTAAMGNPGAVAGALATFKGITSACLAEKLTDIVAINVDYRTGRGDWE